MIIPAALNNALATGTGNGDGSGLTEQQAQMLMDLWEKQGLNPANPLTATTSSISTQSGSIDQELTGDGLTTTTVTRV